MEINDNLGVLLPINEQNGQRAVNARDLHSFLGSKQQFADWIKTRINQYGFIENQDYVILASENYEASWGGKNRVEYALTIDMAKELSMVERSDKGKQARRYFIACEKGLKSLAKPVRKPTITPTKIKASIEWIKGVSEILNLNDSSKHLLLEKIAKPLELPLPAYTKSKGIVKSASELLKGSNMTIRQFNQKMIEKGFLTELERKAAVGYKTFKSLTIKGLDYGENMVNPHNPTSTQPVYYEEKFNQLLTLLS